MQITFIGDYNYYSYETDLIRRQFRTFRDNTTMVYSLSVILSSAIDKDVNSVLPIRPRLYSRFNCTVQKYVTLIYLRSLSHSRLELLETVLFAQIRFHDTVSRGRLLNRFGKDFEGWLISGYSL